ncbi:hypothetical protein KAFR_0G03170 [Kazachstania africana CBS 2517]|uniref:Transcription factor MBP1 n=1 Tax=Kazachstania africana (strain ATCC 22294 / BCRC 22015 / CBS 2517 / CECT 1963 / NBRC 1671 / NRRL Y-8276) TaxID=1071382 RepID=H2AY99_KAZAF|nr:hypothetical protein KAFR_0G03170 [Kazachstania africana CBS 2517]CCF59349.1 hypothetical protein KAFR_0G03170 [Kazachstania africana CBS 2517]
MSNQIYSAKYSGVEVYEFIHPTGSIMKRKKDGWVNATHILKAANFAKAKRTRILEKEVLPGTHEKVQGGFGKYQGTWIPLESAIALAEKFAVYQELKPLFDFTQTDGSESPPPAPKHHHASRTDSSRKKATKSASMSALSDKRLNSSNSVTPVSENGQTPLTVVNPMVSRKRGRPPNTIKAKRRLGVGGPTLQRSQSDMNFPRPNIPNSSITTTQLPTVKLTGRLDTLEEHRNEAKYKELDIDDGLSSDIEPTGNTHNAIESHHIPSGLHRGSVPSVASSPSLPTSPSDFSEANAFDQQHFGSAGTSPTISLIPRYSLTQTRLRTSDINDKVNSYLSKLVDYFISNEMKSDKSVPHELLTPPEHSAPYIDTPIDPEMHTAFHWACSMGNLPIVEALYGVGTSIRSINSQGQTPLMKSSLFHNSYTKRTFPRIFQLLHETVFDVDSNSQTVIHHITKRKSSTPSAVYYLDIVLSKLKDFAPQYRIELLLNSQDSNGDTALHIAAKNGDKSFFNTLIKNGALSTIPNKENQTPDEIMNKQQQKHLLLLEGQNNSVHNLNTNDAAMDDTLMSPSDFIMYPSQAATRFSRGIPNIVSSLKDIAELYNTNYQKRENYIKNVNKTIKSIDNSIKKIDTRSLEILNDGRDLDLKSSLTIKQNEVNEMKNKIFKLKNGLRNRLLKNENNKLAKLLESEKNINEGQGENMDKLGLSLELTKYQLRKKAMLDTIVRLMSDNSKTQKYRRMISEGTEISPEDVDQCLDVILESLTGIGNNDGNTNDKHDNA